MAKHRSLAQMISQRQTASSSVAFRVRRGDQYDSVHWSDIGPRIDAIGAGLLTATSLDDGARITLVGNATLDWIVCDFAALSIGLQTVPIYASLLSAEVAFMHADTEAVIAIVEDKAQLEKLRTAQKGATFQEREVAAEEIKIKHIVVIDPDGVEPADDWESLSDLEARGRSALADTEADRARRAEKLARADVATFTYTSGTTGLPKAVIQTHENMLSMLEAAEEVAIFGDGILNHGLFLFLPPAHSFGRLVELAGPFFGAPLVMSSVPTLAEDLRLAEPGFFPSAPRVYEKMRVKILTAVEGASGFRKAMFRWAMSVGERTIEPRATGAELGPILGLQARLAERLVWSKLRARLGLHQAEVLLSGSAPLSPEVHRFFLALGLNLLEAYGLTETCPGLTSNRPDKFRVGTVGLAFPGIELRLADDGEIQAKGPNITSGYLNRPEATAAAFDDGWFCTGDLGSIDDDGFVKITGRKKELLKTSGGKYVVPAKIEELLKRHPLVQEAVVIGDARNYCVCLLALDEEELESWAATRDIESNARKAAEEDIAAHVKAVNTELASFETMKAFRFMKEPLSVDNQLLTASLKVRRNKVVERYSTLIEEMYAA
ncbi:MAG: long-chain fatty acid--CoA ligase [Myxococcota bacterium]